MKRSPLASILLVTLSLGIAACATTAQDVPAKTVPMTAYNMYKCKDLASEYQRVNLAADAVAERIDQGLLKERFKMGVGVVLFWPALLLIDDQTEHHQQLANLKGERKTLSESLKARGCPPNQEPAAEPKQVLKTTPAARVARL